MRHGFRRSPSGTYVTVDFPGAPDSQLTGINNLSETVGVYDLGNLASTMCPSPSCGAIGFSLHNGHFSSFEDPAAPGITFAQSVNDKGQIAGFYQDNNGNPFGFLRNPADGNFQTIQFPTANNFTTVGNVNNLGVLAGDYQVAFLQGYLAVGSKFLSFDYPNSAISGLHAVNNRGEVGGYFALAGGPVQAYIAIPIGN